MPVAEPAAVVFDLQRFCVHDGPGIRTVVFFKGCPLRCRWCQNPESLDRPPELAFYAERCLGCGLCTRACPNRAVETGRIARARCQASGRCADACPGEALRLVGREESPARLLAQIERDRSYYEATGGGVTLSGGEPLLQAEAAVELLRRCRAAGIGSVVETCGAVPWSSLREALPHVDLFYFDLKAGDEATHRALTGAPLAPIVENARRLLAAGATVTLRMPVVPGLNDSAAELEAVARLVGELGQRELHLLRYHDGGEAKAGRLGRDGARLGIAPSDARAALARAAARLEELGLEVVREGDLPPPHAADRFPERVRRLKRAVQTAAPSVCAERALLVTEHARSRAGHGRPAIINRAEALAHVLARRAAKIHDDELLVGCFSSKRVGGSLYPELHGVPVLLEDLWAFDRRPLNPLRISRRERIALLTRVLPHWLPRFLGLRAFPLPSALRFVAHQLGGREYLINESGGISHFVPDYRRLLELGSSGIAAAAARARAQSDDPEARGFHAAVEIACRGLAALAAPYAREARRLADDEREPGRRAELERIAEVCERVPRHPARTLHEALQSLLFAQIALNLESLDNAVSPGRLDQILYPYYRRDLEAGRIDERGARELVGCFTVKLSELIPVFSRRITRFHGGMFNGQVVVVGGTDRRGADATNDLSWIFLDAMEHLRMRQPNFHARLHAASPPAYVARVARMLRDGSAAPSLMNDEVVVPMLVGRGTSLEDARDYSPVGCVEPVACGVTFGSTDAALVNLALPLERVLGTKRGGEAAPPAAACCRSIEELIELLRVQIEELVARLIRDLHAIERANARLHPTPLTSALLGGCLESGRDASAGGATYNGSGVQGVGVADVADSLAAVDDVVFRRRLCELPTLLRALERDFQGHEVLRGQLLRAPKYGNDDPAADRLAQRVMEIFAGALASHRSTRGGCYWAGFYSVTAHRAFGETTGALPSGRRAGQPLASGLSCANGRDRLGPTAALASAAAADLARLARNGVNVNLKLDAGSLGGEAGACAVAGLVRGYFARGGMQLQLNVLDPALLVEARDHPGRQPWLLVRVSGYSAYFDDLSPAMKQEIIDRSLHRG